MVTEETSVIRQRSIATTYDYEWGKGNKGRKSELSTKVHRI